MRIIIIAAALAAGLAGLAGCGSKNQSAHTESATTATPPRKIPVEDFFRNATSRGYSLSPDGKHILFLKPWNGRFNVYVQAVGSADSAHRVTTEEKRDIPYAFFGNNHTVLYANDFGGDENFHIFRVGMDGNGQRDLTPYPKVRAEMFDDLRDDPAHILINMNKRDPQNFDAYRLNIENGTLTMVAENPGGVQGWVTDNAGHILAASKSEGTDAVLLYRPTDKAPFKEIVRTTFKEQVAPIRFDKENKFLYVSSNRGRDKSAIFEFDPATAKEGKLIYEHPEVDVDGLQFSELRKVPVSVSFEVDKPEHHFLDAEAEKIHKQLQEALGTEFFSIESSDSLENLFTVATYGDRVGGSNYLFDKRDGKLTKLADRRPWLKSEELAQIKPVSYKSRDGLTIHGYLTLPEGRDPKNLPTVMLVHGGPWARDGWGFEPEAQLLANRGYAVFQVNFRGSTGYGRKFWEASFRQWGRKMQDDVSDGVKYLVDHGITNPKRVAIYGGSYGGYATLAGICFSPELYKCAVDYVGVSNLFTFMKTIPPYWEPFRKQMYEMVGDPTNPKDSVLLAETSPALHTDKIVCPLFVAQGKNDPRVNINESDQIVNNLKKRGITVQYMVKDDEGHGFHGEKNRMDFYNAMDAFFEKNL